MDNEVVCIIPQSLFDHLAEKEGQVEDGFKIHAVDRVAGTLRIGAQLMKVVKLVPMEVGTFDRLQIIESTAQEFALRNREKKSIDISSTIPRGAHWRTDHQAYSRLRAINDDRCADSRAVVVIYFPRARCISARSHSIPPLASIFAHSGGGKRIERCSSRSDSGAGGRPRGFFCCSMSDILSDI